MDKMLFKKINLLIHLANIDGEFVTSERELLKQILRDHNLEETYLNEHRHEIINLDELTTVPDKTELLYWVLRIIHADGYLHPSELNYSRLIAQQLGFKKEVIDYYISHPLTSHVDFEKVINQGNYQN